MIVHAIQYLLCVCAVSGTQYYMIIVCMCVRVRVRVHVRVVGGGVVCCVCDLLLLLSCLCKSESVSFRHEIFESVIPVKERKTEKNLLCGFSYLS